MEEKLVLRTVLRDLCDPRKIDIREWYNKYNLEDSMRNALLLYIQQEMVDRASGCFPEKQLIPWRDFFFSVVARKPFATKDRAIIDTVSLVAQTVYKGSDWEKRLKLIDLFLINLRQDE